MFKMRKQTKVYEKWETSILSQCETQKKFCYKYREIKKDKWKMKAITVLSLFDGISCARVALERANIKVNAYYASEIDKYCIATVLYNNELKKNKDQFYPMTKQLGDVRYIKPSEAPKKVDLLIGGSPCQDLSISKKNRKGLDGERSGLFWDYVIIKNQLRPKWFILENVASMSKESKDII